MFLHREYAKIPIYAMNETMNEEGRSSCKVPYGVHDPITLKCYLNVFEDNRTLSSTELT